MPISLPPFVLAEPPATAAQINFWAEPSSALAPLLSLTTHLTLVTVLVRVAALVGAIVVAVLLLRLVPLLERLVLRRATKRAATFDESTAEQEQRVETLTRVTGSVARAIIWMATAILVLGVVGISVAPLLAGAGIAGIALGFGAQSIVKDFFAGFFILFENQFSVGDTVTIAGITGTVEQMTLRITVLRDPSGTAYFVPNSNIGNVANKTHGYTRVAIDASFGPLVPEETIQAALRGVAARVKDHQHLDGVILEDPSIEGPIDIVGGAETWRVIVKSSANRSIEVKRAALSALRRELAASGLGYEAGMIVERPKAQATTSTSSCG